MVFKLPFRPFRTGTPSPQMVPNRGSGPVELHLDEVRCVLGGVSKTRDAPVFGTELARADRPLFGTEEWFGA